MSKTGRPNYRRRDREWNRRPKPEKRIIVEEVQRERPDLQKLSRAFIALKVNEKDAASPATQPDTGSSAVDKGQEDHHEA